MKKRIKITVVAAAVICVAATGIAFAMREREEVAEIPILVEQVVPEAVLAAIDKMKLVADKIYAETEDREDAYLTVLYYAAQLMKYNASAEEQELLHQLILNGADAKRITQIYIFLQDTCYGVELVEPMYAAGVELEGDYWVEDAFNIVTENRHGVLSPEDVRTYLDQGITVNDIQTANVLCRKGVYTIQEILQQVQDGTSWEHIFSEIRGQDIHSQTALLGIFQEEVDPTAALRATRLSEVTGVDTDAFLTAQAEEVLEENETYLSNKLLSEADAYLESIGVIDDAKLTPSVNAEIIGRAVENGMSQEQIDAYLTDGYSDLEILNASEMAAAKNVHMREALQMVEEGGAAQ